jgi:hypothetical protein
MIKQYVLTPTKSVAAKLNRRAPFACPRANMPAHKSAEPAAAPPEKKYIGISGVHSTGLRIGRP